LNMTTRDVTAIGPLNIDLIMWGDGPIDWQSIPVWDGPAGIEMVAAGSIGYTARDFARLGLNVKVVGCVPKDALGTFIIENLRQDGVDTEGVQQVPDSVAGIGAYMLLFGSRKRPLAYRLPSHDPWPKEFSAAEIDDLLDTRLIHNGGYLHFEKMYGGVLDDIFREARRRGVLTSMDPQFPLFTMQGRWIKPLGGVLPFVDIFLCDDHEASHITGTTDLNEAAHILLDAGPEVVVIKMGAEGASIYQKCHHFHQPAIKVGDLVDSIGAGDAFDASFLYATLQGWPLERRAAFAAMAAGVTVTGVGGSATMPSAEVVERLLATDSDGSA
jgi:sugar/nucleoside kinase (ribokinase family)